MPITAFNRDKDDIAGLKPHPILSGMAALDDTGDDTGGHRSTSRPNGRSRAPNPMDSSRLIISYAGHTTFRPG